MFGEEYTLVAVADYLLKHKKELQSLTFLQAVL